MRKRSFREQWELEHLSDDEWMKRHPSGAPIALAIIALLIWLAILGIAFLVYLWIKG